jgi:hypothetical protein
MTVRERKTSRLSPIEENAILPFVRALPIEDVSVYWMPVYRFPMLPQQQEWVLEFHRRLAAHLHCNYNLREECFIQFKTLYPSLMDRFTSSSAEYMPMPGVSLIPGTKPPEQPDFDVIKIEVDNAVKNGLLTRKCKRHRFTRLSERRRVGFLWRRAVALSGAGS